MDNETTARQYLISAEELAGLIGDERIAIIDTRHPEEYAQDHIPGAVNLYGIFTYLATRQNGGYEAMKKTFTERFGNAGLDGTQRVIVYEDNMDSGYGRSCRGQFLLRYLGHCNTQVLHGGYQAWVELDLPLTDRVPVVEQKIFPVRPDETIILTTEEMRASLEDPSIIKLDCRDYSEWIGTSSSPYGPDFAPRKGRIPGAVWIEWYKVMHQDGLIPWFKDRGALQELFATVGITTESRVHIYCFKGARSSNMYIALKLAGVEKIRNYFASWNEWSRDPSLPIEEGYPKLRLRRANQGKTPNGETPPLP